MLQFKKEKEMLFLALLLICFSSFAVRCQSTISTISQSGSFAFSSVGTKTAVIFNSNQPHNLKIIITGEDDHFSHNEEISILSDFEIRYQAFLLSSTIEVKKWLYGDNHFTVTLEGVTEVKIGLFPPSSSSSEYTVTGTYSIEDQGEVNPFLVPRNLLIVAVPVIMVFVAFILVFVWGRYA